MNISGRDAIILIFFLLNISLFFVAIEILQNFKPLIIILTVIVFLLLNKSRFSTKSNNLVLIVWGATLIPIITSLIFTVDLVSSTEFILLYIMSILIFYLISTSNYDLSNIFLKIMYVFSFALLVLTLLGVLLPGLFHSLVLPFLTEEANRAYIHFADRNEFSGISGQTGTNAFLLSVGLAIILFKRKTGTHALLSLLFIIAIVMAEKRGILVANLIALIMIGILYMRNTYSKLLVLIGSLIFLTIFVWYGVNNFNYTINNIDDFSSGRINLYAVAINNFLDNFITGTGIDTFSTFVGVNAHNVYLQLLSEIGIIGTLIFIIAQLSSLLLTIKILLREKHLNNDCSLFLTSTYFQVFFIVYSLFGNGLYDYNFFLIYLIIIGLTLNRNGVC